MAEGHVWFVNPNDPEQPARGVYRWYCITGTKMVTLYVGCSGGRKSVGRPSTLMRGVQELKRDVISSDKERRFLDTDFIVGSAVMYFKAKGYDCYWQHISDEPSQEPRFCKEYKPTLQEGTEITKKFRLTKGDGENWCFTTVDIDLATSELNRLFAEIIERQP
jgi:hypothetical protein